MTFDIGSIQLRELSLRITKGTTPTKGDGFVGCGINYIKSESITTDGVIDTSKFAFIDTKTHEKLARSQLRSGNVLFSMAGIYLGKTAVVMPEHLPANTNQAVGIITLDESKADPYFVHYSLQSPSCRAWVLRSAAQSAQPNFNLQEIGDLKIPAFPIEQQKEIARTLRLFDDRIALLRETNATLEAIAQALFKSWFVDFDPVHAKVRGESPQGMDDATAALFPESFEESELGRIPKGWRVGCIGDLVTVKGGYAYKSTDFTDSGFPVIKIKNIIGDGTVNINDVAFIPESLSKKTKRFALSDGDILMAMTGATIGKVGIFVSNGTEAFLNQRVAKFENKAKEADNTNLAFVAFKNHHMAEQIFNAASGSAQPNISAAGIESARLIIPNSKSILEMYSQSISPAFQSWINNYRQAQTLAQLRDTLLPKLISGQLRLPEAEALLAEELP